MTVSLLNNNTSNNAGTSGTSITGNSASEASDMFTKLLVAQIRNQDPLSPTDPAQFVQQLTQLSQTETLQNLSNLTSANSSILQSMQVLSLGAQVGSNVMAETTTVKLDGSTKVSGQTTLDAASSATSLVLTGSDGVDHTINLGVQAPGTVPFTIDPAQLGLGEGTYTMKVVTSTGSKPTIDIQGRLNSVRLGATGSVVLNVANIGETSTTAITAFNGPATAAASATQSAF
ncbi:flagellar basal-body rod modification protein FlgD [Duganella sp. 1224]|uniref:flagellar hook capping FlgD N-terminal domain-containing protein n=1 Tax=Duganella sp. 1224 TaxID=2587052 RepID=UPI0015CD84E0|nr:flagellar hook capping FlgD N-terminal domain-containing protein [Duganella sp. 1224]NYE59731.1 flagellar basal-body rod modification protein FlgD [Duganella sp. 1224]